MVPDQGHRDVAGGHRLGSTPNTGAMESASDDAPSVTITMPMSAPSSEAGETIAGRLLDPGDRFQGASLARHCGRLPLRRCRGAG